MVIKLPPQEILEKVILPVSLGHLSLYFPSKIS